MSRKFRQRSAVSGKKDAACGTEVGMARKHVSRKQLNEVMRQLPVPLREHSRRVKLLASFLTEKLRLDDAFLEGGYDEKKICDAVYYHDIGKAAIPRDDYYLKYCKTAAKRENYYSHVGEGLEIAQRDIEDFLIQYGPNDFETYLYEAIAEHHERLNGEGFPYGKSEEEISLTGRICAVVDVFDNELFVGNGGRVDFDEAVASFKANAEGLDETLIQKFFEDMDALRAFVDFIAETQAIRRKQNDYGIHVVYRPIMDIRENAPRALRTELTINDPYYGVVRQGAFQPIAIRTGSIVQLEKLALRKVCFTLRKLTRQKVKLLPVAFALTMQQFERKGFFKELEKILAFYDIPASQFCFGVREEEIAGSPVDLPAMLQTLSSMGAQVAVLGFGGSSSIMTTLETLSLNKVFLPEGSAAKAVESPNTYSVVSGIAKIAQNLHIDVVMEGVTKREIEASAMRMGLKYAVGSLYGEEIPESGLYRFLSEQGGAT